MAAYHQFPSLQKGDERVQRPLGERFDPLLRGWLIMHPSVARGDHESPTPLSSSSLFISTDFLR